MSSNISEIKNTTGKVKIQIPAGTCLTYIIPRSDLQIRNGMSAHTSSQPKQLWTCDILTLDVPEDTLIQFEDTSYLLVSQKKKKNQQANFFLENIVTLPIGTMISRRSGLMKMLYEEIKAIIPDYCPIILMQGTMLQLKDSDEYCVVEEDCKVQIITTSMFTPHAIMSVIQSNKNELYPSVIIFIVVFLFLRIFCG